MQHLGLFGIVFPAQWGGSDGDFTSLCIAIEEVGQVSQSLGITLSAAVGLGAVFMHLGARVNWHRLFMDLIADFDLERLRARQTAALERQGLALPS